MREQIYTDCKENDALLEHMESLQALMIQAKKDEKESLHSLLLAKYKLLSKRLIRK